MNSLPSSKDLILDLSLRDAGDPASDQRKASAPDRHVWVRASAGSGKTKVLIDRLLRLLLPDPVTNAPGVAPDKILCLTFTKAGAAEMSLRLQKRLLSWSGLKEEKLMLELEHLIGAAVSKEFFNEARRLFAKILDAPSRLRILTIHSFCQSVLGRFPVETGLSPDFKVIEEAEASEFLRKVLQDAIIEASENPAGDLGQAFLRLAIYKNLEQLREEIQTLIGEPLKVQNFLSGTVSLPDVQNKIAHAFGFADLKKATRRGFCSLEQVSYTDIKAYADLLAASTPKDKSNAAIIHDWLSAQEEERFARLEEYLKAFHYASRGPAKDHPDYAQLKARELARLDRCVLAQNILSTADLLYLGSRVLKAYERHKKILGVMDYDDLIFYTSRLLSGDFWQGDAQAEEKKFATAWVLYKLDEGIDHILVDESQDTNPEQWDIVRRLSEEYFAGNARDLPRPRTLFVVGDEKQSIFSFQRADPAEFYRMRDYFAEKIRPFQTDFEESLIFSFRSTSPVLKLTDAVFENPALGQHISRGTESLLHISHRTDIKKEAYGSVELWPPVREQKKTSSVPGWELPFDKGGTEIGAQQRLAARIAQRIAVLIAKGEAEPGDFMILMRTRSPLMSHIIKEIKKLDIPVSGLDRFVLSESLIIEDLLALCDFVLLPHNDFALACLLKSPFIGLSEGELMALNLTRPTERLLWSALLENEKYKPITSWLSKLMAFSTRVQPYEFLEEILTLPCPADPDGSGYRACLKRLGHDTLEPLDEILSAALTLELQDIRTLQDFTAYLRASPRQVKRENEGASHEVRIMTVHASKGLEAPIVILPDTTSLPDTKKTPGFLWPEKSGLSAPLWAENSDMRSKTYETALKRAQDLGLEEYSRLLYVALTRARDRLIICGATKSETIKPETWYGAIEVGFSKLPHSVTSDSGEKVFALPGTAPRKEKPAAKTQTALPSWIYRSAPSEAPALHSYAPSAQGEDAEPIYSPLDQSENNRFRRGLATHKLLQILPDLDPARREETARRFVARPSLHLGSDLQDSIVSETMRVLNDPMFAPVFAPDSLAEVPVSGIMTDGRIINGQIDRLVITAKDILIVDYKTNRPSPQNAAEVPKSYYLQLKAYADALRLIYPGRTVKCALLWTDRPSLMPVSI